MTLGVPETQLGGWTCSFPRWGRQQTELVWGEWRLGNGVGHVICEVYQTPQWPCE